MANTGNDSLEEEQESFPENDEMTSSQITVVHCRGCTWPGSGGRGAVTPEGPGCSRAAGRAVAPQGSHTGAINEKLQPVGRAHAGEALGELSPMGSPSWSRARVRGESNGSLGYSERGGTEIGSEAEPVRNRVCL